MGDSVVALRCEVFGLCCIVEVDYGGLCVSMNNWSLTFVISLFESFAYFIVITLG